MLWILFQRQFMCLMFLKETQPLFWASSKMRASRHSDVIHFSFAFSTWFIKQVKNQILSCFSKKQWQWREVVGTCCMLSVCVNGGQFSLYKFCFCFTSLNRRAWFLPQGLSGTVRLLFFTVVTLSTSRVLCVRILTGSNSLGQPPGQKPRTLKMESLFQMVLMPYFEIERCRVYVTAKECQWKRLKIHFWILAKCLKLQYLIPQILKQKVIFYIFFFIL